MLTNDLSNRVISGDLNLNPIGNFDDPFFYNLVNSVPL